MKNKNKLVLLKVTGEQYFWVREKDAKYFIKHPENYGIDDFNKIKVEIVSEIESLIDDVEDDPDYAQIVPVEIYSTDKLKSVKVERKAKIVEIEQK